MSKLDYKSHLNENELFRLIKDQKVKKVYYRMALSIFKVKSTSTRPVARGTFDSYSKIQSFLNIPNELWVAINKATAVGFRLRRKHRIA